MYRDDWVVLDAAHDAHQDRLLAESRGLRIEHPERWESRAALRLRMAGRRKRKREHAALGLFMLGDNSDLYGRLPVLHGEDYIKDERKKKREQERKRTAKRLAEGWKRGRDGWIPPR